MADAVTLLGDHSAAVLRLVTLLSNKRLKIAAPTIMQPSVRSIASEYFEFVRPALEETACRAGLVSEVDTLVQTLVDMASVPLTKHEYYTPLERFRVLILEATLHLMKARGTPRLLLSQTERALLGTLEKMLPGSAKSYEQALRDIAQGTRVSWRGTAAELRDVLREVIDHLAPDEQVRVSEGFQLETGLTGPSQTQKVRFILKARRTGRAAIQTAQGTLQTVDEAVATLARTTYTRGSASAHTSPPNTEIRNLKRYVDALLAELLEIAL
jgi:hypothetical protein